MDQPSTLLIGYGNLDRQDDGVAWHILVHLAQQLGRDIPDPYIGFQPAGLNPDLLFALQLTPEMSELVSQYDRVCFIDAHTGDIPEDIAVRPVSAFFQASTFTHHLTPDSLLSLAETLYKKAPEAILVSVKGFEFEFSQEMSPETTLLAHQVLPSIINWYTGEK